MSVQRGKRGLLCFCSRCALSREMTDSVHHSRLQLNGTQPLILSGKWKSGINGNVAHEYRATISPPSADSGGMEMEFPAR